MKYLRQIYTLMETCRSVSRELPGHFPFIVEREYIKDILLKWDRPATALCERVYRILTDHTQELVHQHFATFGQGMLEHQIRRVLTLGQ